MKTNRNLGHHERIIRIAIGVILLTLFGFTSLPGWGDLTLMVIGLIALLTGLIGYCPVWHGMRINTCKGSQKCNVPKPKEAFPEHKNPTTEQS